MSGARARFVQSGSGSVGGGWGTTTFVGQVGFAICASLTQVVS